MALGATRGRVLGHFLLLGSRRMAAGLLLGAGLFGFAAAWLDRRLLYGVTPYDPATHAAVAVLLAVVSTAAVVGAARRATRLDPREALRVQ